MSALKTVTAAYEAFGKGDVPSVLGMMHPEIHWHEAESNPYNPSGEAWVGPEAVVGNLFVKLGEEWDGFAIHPELFHDAGDDGRSVLGHAQGNREAPGNSGLPHLDAERRQARQVPAIRGHGEVPGHDGCSRGVTSPTLP